MRTPEYGDQVAAARGVVLEQLRVHLRRYLSPWMAEHLTVEAHREFPGDAIALDIYTDLLTEKLPPQTVTQRVRYEHPEAVGRKGYAVDARFATWFDHFAATYRGRWWARLLRLNRRRIRYQFVRVPYITSAPVRCDHRVQVSILDAWRYPQAATSLRDIRGVPLGEPVLDSSGYVGDATPKRPFLDIPWT